MTEDQLEHLQIRSVLIPLQGETLLLPNATMAEVVAYREPSAISGDKPDWLLGTVAWRQHAVPLLSFEQLLGKGVESTGHRRRIAICHSLAVGSEKPYLGIVTQGIPRLVQVDEDGLQLVNSAEEERDWPVISRVQLREDLALIPDLDRVSRLVLEAA